MSLPARCDAGLKEWAVAIEALATGRQALIIRKGGIREEGKRFRVLFPEFLLFPSFEHQQIDLLKPGLADTLSHGFDLKPDPAWLTFTHFARVHAVYSVSELPELEALSPHHIWSDDYAKKRLLWKPRVALTAMVLRVYALPEPKRAPWRPEYGGCKSWLQLLDTVELGQLMPAMADDAFAAEATAIHQALDEVRAAAATR
jgi:hypothetical protein